MTGSQPAPEPLDRLAAALWWAVVTAAVLAGLGLALPGRAGLVVAGAAVTVVAAAPLLRVAWLVTAWARIGDRRFVRTGLALLAVVAAGAGLAVLT